MMQSLKSSSHDGSFSSHFSFSSRQQLRLAARNPDMPPPHLMQDGFG